MGNSPMTLWEWELLMGAISHYEVGRNITSAGFPADVISHYWKSGNYNSEDLFRIATQFADCDHGLRGEDDWMSRDQMDAEPWLKFYNFCRGYVHGFAKISVRVPGSATCKTIDGCFRANIPISGGVRTRWYKASDYIDDPIMAAPLDSSFVKSIVEHGAFGDEKHNKEKHSKTKE